MKKTVSLILTFLMLLTAMPVTVIAEESTSVSQALAAFSESASTVVSPSDFLSMGASGNITKLSVNTSYMSAQKVAIAETERMPFSEAVGITLHTLAESWIQQNVSYTMNAATLTAGNTALLKLTVKASDVQDGGSPKMAVTYYSPSVASAGGDAMNGRRIDGIDSGIIPTDGWKTYYYPFTACSGMTTLIFKAYKAKQTILYGDMELIDYGTTVTEAQLSTALKGANGSEERTVTSNGTHTYYVFDAELTPIQPPTPKNAEEAVDNLVESSNASVAVCAEDFLALSAKGGITSFSHNTEVMSASVKTLDNTVEKMFFDKALELKCVNPTAAANWIACWYRFGIDSTKFSVGDTVLLKYTTRSADSETSKMSLRLWDNSSVNAINQSTTYAVADTWNSYYFPFTVTGSIAQVILKTSVAVQTHLIGDFEIINFGTGVSFDNLKNAIKPFATSSKEDSLDTHYICPAPEKESTGTGGEGGGSPAHMPITMNYFTENAQSSGSSASIAVQNRTSSEKLPFDKSVVSTCSSAGSVGSCSVICNVDPDADATVLGETVYLTFYARGIDKSAKLLVDIQNSSGGNVINPQAYATGYTGFTYNLTTQWIKFCLPVQLNATAARVSFSHGGAVGAVEIGGVTLQNYGIDTGTNADKLIYSLPQGPFLMEDFEQITMMNQADAYTSEDGLTIGSYIEKSDGNKITACNYVCTNGSYVYAISNGKFFIIDMATDSVVGSYTASSPDSLGYNTRQLRVSDDGNTAFITSRESGCFIMDCTDKTNPVLASRYDSIEYATGCCIDGTTAFVANRVFGIDVVDISDPYNPECISVIRSGEAQSCEVDNGILYIGCWGDRDIQVWDVHQPSNPIKIFGDNESPIVLDGLGDGLAIHGNYLYASTGHYGKGVCATFNAPGWAQGNGLDIYDISDIRNPKWVSTVKTDDHFKVTGQDFWEAKISEFTDSNNEQRIYCYITNTYLGVMIYDVTNPYAPIRLAQISYLTNLGTQVNNGTNSYFPYLRDDPTALQSPVCGIAVTDGTLYVGAVYSGIAKLETSLAHALTPSVHGTLSTPAGHFFDMTADDLSQSGFANAKYAHLFGQVAGIVESDGIIYAACGLGGIQILDSELTLLKEYKSGYCISDIQICEGRTYLDSNNVLYNKLLYVAEGSNGASVYAVASDGITLKKLSSYISPHGDIKSIRISPNGYYAACDAGQSKSELLDCTDLNRIVRCTEIIDEDGVTVNTFNAGLCYKRQIINGLVGGNKTGVYTHMSPLKVFEFDPKPDGTEGIPKVYNILRQGLNISQYSGFAALDDGTNRMIATLAGSYVIFDLDNEYSTAISLNSNTSNITEFENQTVPTTDPTYKVLRRFYDGNTANKTYGKPYICGNVLFLTDINSGLFTAVDISDLYNPETIMSYNFKANPYIACVTENHIFIPLGYQGIVRFDLPQHKVTNTVSGTVQTVRADVGRVNLTNPGRFSVKNATNDTVYFAIETDSSINSVISLSTSLCDGSYTYRFEKNGYLPIENSFTVSNGNVSIGALVLVPGDIISDFGNTCGDGIIDVDDFIRLLRAFGSSVTDALKNAVDIDEDGIVNINDLTYVKTGLINSTQDSSQSA